MKIGKSKCRKICIFWFFNRQNIIFLHATWQTIHSEEEQIIQKTVDLNEPLTKDMEKAMAQQKGDFGEITEENHEKDNS